MVSIPSSDQDDEFEEIPVFGTKFKTNSKEVVFLLIFEDRSQNRCCEPRMVSIDLCRAEASEVKYMMLLNALNESEREKDVDAPNLNENGESEKP
jgi:hypothetical protein